MKNKWRKFGEVLLQNIAKNLNRTEGVPFIFKEKMLKAGLLAFGVIILGTYMGVQSGEKSFFILSWILGMFSFYQILRFLKIGKAGNYEVVEGEVLSVKGKYTPLKNRQVTIQDKNGACICFIIQKDKKIMTGKRYRFYFEKREQMPNSLTRGEKLSHVIFYGMEEIPQEER